MIPELKQFLNERAMRNLGRELRPDELLQHEGIGDEIWTEATRRAQERIEGLQHALGEATLDVAKFEKAALEHEKAAVEQAVAETVERCAKTAEKFLNGEEDSNSKYVWGRKEMASETQR